ncbi:MAG: UDP-N-acetylmuramate dehydrogenase [Bacteroidetes bacterium]|nr:UDP-N-acetylmuramate dehydrogenase [Bacteroidota bacterium]
MHLDQKVSLKALHTFGMEVEARYFVEAKTQSEVLTLLNYRQMIHMPILFLGGGSNVLFTRDFSGIVIKISAKGISAVETDDGHVLVSVEAGENWDEFVQYCVNRGWSGLENLSLIPGTVGAAPIQNIGAYGVEVKEIIESVLVVDINTAKQRRLTNAECSFGYRDSVFKNTLKGKVIILNVTFKLLNPNLPTYQLTNLPPYQLHYPDLQHELASMSIAAPAIADIREAVCRIRRRKLPDTFVAGNAGSFFKNPVIMKEQLDSLKATFPDLPHFPNQGKGTIKIPAAWLIDQCGWKGYRNGDAGVHPNQPLVLVNYGNATGRQILDLANQIMESVKQKFGILLEMEVNVF